MPPRGKGRKRARTASGPKPRKSAGRAAPKGKARKKPKAKTTRRRSGRGSRGAAGGMALLVAIVATGAGAQYVSEHGGAKAPAFQCDLSIREHVYNIERFDGSNRTCVLAVGTIALVKKDPDLDYHIQLDLDEGQEWMVNPFNGRHQGGNLVAEPICAHAGLSGTQDRHRQACAGYTSKVHIPKVGDRVAVVGEFVVDKAHYRDCATVAPTAQHCWSELHPVTSITPIE